MCPATGKGGKIKKKRENKQRNGCFGKAETKGNMLAACLWLNSQIAIYIFRTRKKHIENY